MTGTLSGSVSVVPDANGNNYLCLQADKASTKTAEKKFEVPTVLKTATVSFKWYTTSQTSDSRQGSGSIQLWQAGDETSEGKEVLALYMGEMRSTSDSTKLRYSVAGLDNAVTTDITATHSSVHDVNLQFDFATSTVTITIDGQVVGTPQFDASATRIDQLVFKGEGPLGSGKTFALNMGIDDFSLTYEENATINQDAIHALATLEDVMVSKEDWASYKHPETVTATLVNGETIEVPIDAATWTCTPEFDENQKGWYTWTANIIAPEDHPNTNGLTVSYRMGYTGVTSNEHYYEEDFMFDIWDAVAWGKDLDATSGTGGFSLSQKTDENGNSYMLASALNQGGSRGSRLNLSEEIVKSSTVTFDWNPVTASTGNGQVLFISPNTSNSYFTLRFDSNFNLYYYTECPLTGADTEQKPFEGSISAENAVNTGLSGNNKWYTVKLDFDYTSHTADLTITERDDASKSYTVKDVPIATEAVGLKAMVLHMQKVSGKPSVEMGIDNMTVDYSTFGAQDIVSIENPKDVNVAKVAFDEFEFPTEVTATLGDGSEVSIPVGEWTASPEFDKEKNTVYTWTAPIENGDYTNYFGLQASFDMDYTAYPYPTYAYNPKTLELEFGEELPAEFPTTVTAYMSDGTTRTDIPVSEWEPIYEFNSQEEGIYVYGAYLEDIEGEVSVDHNKLAKNEQHVSGENQEAYQYDVYYRISYFKSEDNYNAYARSMEYLDRGVYAVQSENGILVSWRLLVTEYGEDVKFYVNRNGEQITDEPITNKTNFVDIEGKAGDVYTVVTVKDGKMTESDGYTATEENYLSIPLQKPDAQPDKDGNLNEYSINDSGVADVDGDGQYEIIVKWYPADAFDSGKQNGPSAPTIFDVYEMDGTPLWRLNMGLECPSGAHWNQFMAYDMDQDGKAEFFIKTSDGTVSYKPNAEGVFDMTDESTIVSYVGDKSVVPGSNINSTGHVNANSNEYVTVFNGQTGEVIDSVDFVNKTENFDNWGDNWGNRASRYNIAIGYIPTEQGSTNTIPAVFVNRGYYAKTTVAAYTLRDGKLNLDWNFDSDDNPGTTGKGNHNVASGDVDQDGFDELVLGALAIDHDGSVLWVKDGTDGQDYAGHADAIHLAAMNPEDPTQLYVFTPQEDQNSTLNCHLSNAATGARIGGVWTQRADIGRGVAANITPEPGYEYWAGIPNSEGTSAGGIYNFNGDLISNTMPSNFSINWTAYWDGDLLSELADGSNPASAESSLSVYKYNWENNTVDVLMTAEGTKMNNSTKNNPSLSADLLGDWREEIMVRSQDNTELRIYMTDVETDYMIYTLMHDPVYRNAVANQNTAYNQPAHLGFYLGEDNKDQVLSMQLPTANVVYTTEEPEGSPLPSATPAPTAQPSEQPTTTPTPTTQPSEQPTVTPAPTAQPSAQPTATPVPTTQPLPNNATQGQVVSNLANDLLKDLSNVDLANKIVTMINSDTRISVSRAVVDALRAAILNDGKSVQTSASLGSDTSIVATLHSSNAGTVVVLENMEISGKRAIVSLHFEDTNGNIVQPKLGAMVEIVVKGQQMAADDYVLIGEGNQLIDSVTVATYDGNTHISFWAPHFSSYAIIPRSEYSAPQTPSTQAPTQQNPINATGVDMSVVLVCVIAAAGVAVIGGVVFAKKARKHHE